MTGVCPPAGVSRQGTAPAPPPDRCNAVDDDCDGAIDEDGCSRPEDRCVHGMCAAPCQAGLCPCGGACLEGRCVPRCAGVACPAGETCTAGGCRPDPCPTTRCGPRERCEAWCSSGTCWSRCVADWLAPTEVEPEVRLSCPVVERVPRDVGLRPPGPRAGPPGDSGWPEDAGEAPAATPPAEGYGCRQPSRSAWPLRLLLRRS